MKIIIVNKDGEVQDEIDLTGYDLNKAFDRGSIIGHITETVEGHEDE